MEKTGYNELGGLGVCIPMNLVAASNHKQYKTIGILRGINFRNALFLAFSHLVNGVAERLIYT